MRTNCYACGAPLEPEYGSEEQAFEHEQWDNALVVRLEGGYGMFIDPIPPSAAGPHPERGVLRGSAQVDYKVVICHACAHAACEALPWLNRLIDPMRSHAHKAWRRLPDDTTEVVEWGDHQGWDLPHGKETA